jgi:hypothetical protein
LRLFDFGGSDTRSFIRQILEWSQKRVSFEDNIDILQMSSFINTSETVVEHKLGRIPKALVPILTYPNKIVSVEFTKAPDAARIYIKAASACEISFFIY